MFTIIDELLLKLKRCSAMLIQLISIHQQTKHSVTHKQSSVLTAKSVCIVSQILFSPEYTLSQDSSYEIT